MKKINLLGISLIDYTLKEALKISNQYLNTGALSTISFVSTQILVEVGENPERKEWLESVDMMICEETDILRASDTATRNRIREVENGEFLQEFLRRLVWYRKKIFLLADNEKRMEQLKADLQGMQEKIIIVGEYVLDELTGDIDTLINEINDIVPNVVISRFPPLVQERLMFENKQMINADIWLALPEHYLAGTKKGIRKFKLLTMFYKKMFKRRLSQYNHEKAE